MIHPRLTVMSFYYVEYIVSFHLWGFAVSITSNQSIEISGAVIIVVVAAQTQYVYVCMCVSERFFLFSMVIPYVQF